jgi:hypothetical protein
MYAHIRGRPIFRYMWRLHATVPAAWRGLGLLMVACESHSPDHNLCLHLPRPEAPRVPCLVAVAAAAAMSSLTQFSWRRRSHTATCAGSSQSHHVIPTQPTTQSRNAAAHHSSQHTEHPVPHTVAHAHYHPDRRVYDPPSTTPTTVSPSFLWSALSSQRRYIYIRILKTIIMPCCSKPGGPSQ